MQPMVKCSLKWGTDTIYSGSPKTVFHHQAIFMPNGAHFGVYDQDGHMIAEAVDFRSEEMITKQDIGHNIDPFTVLDTAPDALYIYCGVMNGHFGHFLINTLSRFWSNYLTRNLKVKYIYHGADISSMYNLSFVKHIFNAMGLRCDDFVSFDSPTRIKNLIVPDTSFAEQRGGYKCFRDLCLRIGRELSPVKEREKRPIYYSKTQLQSGVGGFENENEIEAVMASNGVEIIYPEMLSISEQIALLNSRSLVFGTAGSFLHNSIFCENIPKFAIINPSLQINTNYLIIDNLTGSEIDYYHPTDMEVLPSEVHTKFLTTRKIPNAALRAQELLQLAGLK